MDTSTARARILARIRSRQGRDALQKPAEAAERARWLAEHPRGPLPALEGDPVAHFQRMAARLETSLDRIATWAEAPAAVARHLAGLGLPGQGVAYPGLAALDWVAAGLALEARAPRDGDLLAVTGCFCAVAETGSLVFASSPDSPAAAHLLPETHIVLLPVDRIDAHQEDAFERMRRELGQIPRGFNTVSGPSRTADIEQTIVIGAHGPYRVHVILIDAPRPAA